MAEQNMGPDFDLQPDPRILPMLGEINLRQWRCLAELVDNAIDGFLRCQRGGNPCAEPEVHVTVPTADIEQSRISVRDNGPGMSRESLEKAVRAGWTSNDPIRHLGLFGMGFNIATARLGLVTQVWATQKGDGQWRGLEIDFEKLIRQGSFRTPELTRPKPDSTESGVEVSILRLKPEQSQWFARASNRTQLTQVLGQVYSAMLRQDGQPMTFRLYLNGRIVAPRNHCAWGAGRTVESSRHGILSAIQPVDTHLPSRPFCQRCWQWLTQMSDACPICGAVGALVMRDRHIHGWLGIQRYLSQEGYGIDFIRNGRKLELGNKDLFYWDNGESQELEYPIDDPRNRGRIVGEIHLDHCRVSYTKDRFEREDPAWEDMVKVVRGEGPLRPDKAQQAGLPVNTSPLSKLFQCFRRSSPKPKVAGCYAKLLIVPDNDRASQMAKRFYAGEAEWQTDEPWWALVQEADNVLLTPPDTDGGGLGPLSPAAPETPSPEGPGGPTPSPSAPQPPTRQPIASLTQEYRDDLTNQRWDVRAFDVESSDVGLGTADSPWGFGRSTQGYYEFLVNARHPVFRSMTMTPLDGLLAQLAWSAMDFERDSGSGHSFAAILASLRGKYGGVNELDPVTLSSEAGMALTRVAKSLKANLSPGDGRTLFNALSPSEQEEIQRRMAAKAVSDPQAAIDQGRFLEYASWATLLEFFQSHPELFFDGKYWDERYASLDFGSQGATEMAWRRLVGDYSALLSDATWLAARSSDELNDASRERVMRAALAVDMLAPASGSGDAE
ncbi:MAG: hypothetical protein BIFFINMI_00588 [Phycisphaerae bacterium]|nr:hypothetical protein [Phycisphaerae bacterium]